MKLHASFLTCKALSRLAKTVAGQTLFPYNRVKPPLNKVALKPSSVRPIHPNHDP